ncbi:MAG: thioether cross-link-forming SCIFF peptide maturase [Bacillota bacterium]
MGTDLAMSKDANWHVFSALGRPLLLDVKTGGLHELDAVARDVALAYGEPRTEIIRRLGPVHTVQAVAEAIEEFDGMVAEGRLSRPDTPDEPYMPQGEVLVKALCLHVAHDCNLRCRYCFGNTGTFGMTRELMPERVARAAIDFLLGRSGARRNLNVDFFGGEPLLNFDVVRSTVEYGRKRAEAQGKRIEFTITTNAALLDGDVAEFLDENDMLVVLSLDGRREVHDRMRVAQGGGGTYDLVAPRVTKFIANRSPDSYFVRATYTRANLDFASDVLHLADLGCRSISAEPVVGGRDSWYGIRMEDLGVIEREYERLARLFVQRHARGQGFSFYHFNVDLDGGPCLARRLSGCGAGVDYLAVAPSGGLYPCHQFVGRPEFLMGDVFNGGIDPELVARFRNTHVYTKKGCAECWARFICSGGCHANAYASSGDILAPDPVACAIQKKRIECALAVQAILTDRRREALAQEAHMLPSNAVTQGKGA